ncbi:hypothetical protein IGJ01_000945 [Enterococcus sp. AZ089]|uniref:DUF7006 family protein n=1 Tax=Enterococcus sp. AZ089 TaxID=2774693 RepID=UPI003D2FE46A
MSLFKTQEEYIEYFQGTLLGRRNETEWDDYINKQLCRLDELTAIISEETFWQVFPQILGIDARLNLLAEFISYDVFSSQEIICIVENDFQTYFKELCGYNLKMPVKPLMIFNVD